MPTTLPRLTTSKPSGSKATVTLKSALKAPRSDAPRLSPKAAGKRKAVQPAEEDEEESDAESNATGFSELLEEEDGDEMMGDEMDVDAASGEGESGDEADTDEEIGAAKEGKTKSKKNTKKRKAPTSADTFGATLTSLLSTDPAAAAASAPSKRPRTQPASTAQPILSLSAKAPPPSSNKLALEAKAKRVIKAQKQEREDRARVKDVVEGWAPRGEGMPGGQEWERSLRKVAQRGVVKLFNAILVASQTNPTNPADLVNNERKSKKEKDNILGRGGKEERLTKEGFLDMIKAGGK